MNGAELARAMALLAAEHRAASAPGGLERAVLAEFDAARRRRRGWGIALGAGIAATLIAGAVQLRERPAPRPAVVFRPAAAAIAVVKPVERPHPRRRVAVSRSSFAEQPFITIPYTVPLAPEENVTVVRMTISPSAMAAAGFPLPAIDPGSGTEADVLVGEDGRARAIRIVTGVNP
jgi:hypothetical protein